MFFVYVDLTTEKTPRAFYVGHGNATRVHDVRRRSNTWRAIAKKYGHERVVIYQTADEQDAIDVEGDAVELTLRTRSHGRDGHWGANHTYRGQFLHRNQATPRGRSWNKGTKLSEEQKLKMKMRRPKSIEHREKIRAGVRRYMAEHPGCYAANQYTKKVE